MVKDVAKKSMQKAVDEVRALPEYSGRGGNCSFIYVCVLHLVCYVLYSG